MKTVNRSQLPYFATAEVLVGCGLTKREFDYLARESLVPAPIEAGGPGRSQLFDFVALGWFAVTGLFLTIGFPMAASAMASSLFVKEITANDSGWSLDEIFRAQERDLVAAGEIQNIPMVGGTYCRAHMHEALRRSSSRYRPYQPSKADLRLRIADGTHAQWAGARQIAMADGSTRTQMPLFELERNSNLRRSKPRLITFFERVSQPAWPESEVMAEYDGVFARASALTELNIDLAIRNALDRIYDARHGLAGAT